MEMEMGVENEYLGDEAVACHKARNSHIRPGLYIILNVVFALKFPN